MEYMVAIVCSYIYNKKHVSCYSDLQRAEHYTHTHTHIWQLQFCFPSLLTPNVTCAYIYEYIGVCTDILICYLYYICIMSVLTPLSFASVSNHQCLANLLTFKESWAVRSPSPFLVTKASVLLVSKLKLWLLICKSILHLNKTVFTVKLLRFFIHNTYICIFFIPNIHMIVKK